MDYRMKLAEYHGLMKFDNPYHGKEWQNNYKFIASYVASIEKEHHGQIPPKIASELHQFLQDAIDIHTKTYILPEQVERKPGNQESSVVMRNGKPLRYATIEDIFKDRPMED